MQDDEIENRIQSLINCCIGILAVGMAGLLGSWFYIFWRFIDVE
jgi:hypothetical protein